VSEIYSGLGRTLKFAAAPTFAAMALATAFLGDGGGYILCSTERASLLSGMVPMYLLMSAFHSLPWLKLIAIRSRGSSPGPRPSELLRTENNPYVRIFQVRER
jgi:hypothetical protein